VTVPAVEFAARLVRRTYMRTFLAAAAVACAAVAAAQPEDPESIVRRMKDALEPPRASVRQMTLTVSAPEGEVSGVTLVQARKPFPDGPRVLTVVLAPADRRGVAFLTRELPDRSAVEQSVWVPAVRRVRTILPVEGLTPFLDSDFTLADLGFVDLHAKYELAPVSGRENTYELREVPQSPQAPWYFSRIVTWIRKDSLLPLERQYFDPAGQLWKVEKFEQVSVVNGVPTVFDATMEDRLHGGRSELRVDQVRYDVALPDDLFDAKRLRDAAESPVWTSGAMVRRTSD
jgi:outer membrane lipoprotein-sorting protein